MQHMLMLLCLHANIQHVIVYHSMVDRRFHFILSQISFDVMARMCTMYTGYGEYLMLVIRCEASQIKISRSNK